MSTGNHIKHFSAADIERYHKGLLSSKERHDLEKAALDDPFLADALEGYAVADLNVAADLAELRKRLGDRTEQSAAVPMATTRKTFSPALRIAAMLIIVVGAGLLLYQFGFNKRENSIAQNKPQQETVKSPDQAKTSTPGYSAVTTNQAPVTATTTKDSAGPVDVTSKSESGKGAVQPGLTTIEKANETSRSDQQVAETKSVAPIAPIVTVDNQKKSAERDMEELVKREKEADKDATRTRGLTRKTVAKDDVAKESKAEQPAAASNERSVVTAPAKSGEQNYYRNQANTFRGRVTDASNVGLPFANVTNVQDNVGTYTDANGNFTLTSTDSVLNVQIRSLGYDNANTQLRNDAASNRVVMQEDRSNLSEVVISNKKPNATARANDSRKLIEPEPQDGWVKYDSYLANNLNIPDDFQQKNSSDNSVQLSFEVDKNGEPINIRIEKSLCSSCDKEAIRLVKEGPKWKRNASKKGRTTVTINF
jgi:hypothetical protein